MCIRDRVHTTLDLDLQNATLDAINKHMDALEARKDFKDVYKRQAEGTCFHSVSRRFPFPGKRRFCVR